MYNNQSQFSVIASVIMGRLTKLDVVAWEALGKYLRDHHWARLYMTGDQALQQLIEAIRTRRFTTGTNLPSRSELVQRILIGGACDAVTSFRHFEGDDFAKFPPSRLRRLVLYNFSALNDGRASLKRIDLSRFTLLDTFVASGDYTADCPLHLPASITSVRLNNATCRDPIHKLGELASLTHLKIGFGDGIIADFLPIAHWPQSLSSLEINVRDRRVNLEQHLPKTLTSLKIWGVPSINLDVSALSNALPLLHSLCAVNDVRVDGPISPTLTDLDVHRIRVPVGLGIVDVLRHFPLSITRLDLLGFESDAAGWDERVKSDLHAAMNLILPQLDLKSIGLMFRMIAKCFLKVVELEEQHLFASYIAKYGLDSEYLAWRLRCGHHLDGKMPFADVVDLLGCGVSAAGVTNVLRGQTVERPHDFADDKLGLSYVPLCFDMLSMGLTDTLRVVPAIETYTVPMSEVEIFNLVHLQVHISAHTAFASLVAANKLTCLEQIVVIERQGCLDPILNAVYEHRENLPRLERITIPCSAASSMDMDIAKKLLEMRLVLSNNRCFFTYQATAISNGSSVN